MQKTKIEWCDSTWSPVTGCRRGCTYCYARRIAERFGGYDNLITPPLSFTRKSELSQPLPVTRKNGKTVDAAFPFGFDPTLHSYRLADPKHKKKPQNIFVCSMGDLFGPWVPKRWIVDVMDACIAAPQHRYLFLTKYPERYLELEKYGLLPQGENFWYGSTATHPETDMMMYSDKFHTFASIEPLMGPFGRDYSGALEFIDWFIVGAETGNRKGKVVPKREWVEEIIDYCRAFHKPIFMKDSLIPIMGESGMLRQFPWEEGVLNGLD